MTFWKATREDGTDFYTGIIHYVPGEVVRHPEPDLDGDASGYLSVADAPTECTGMSWPCKLFEVEPVGDCRRVGVMPHKIACVAMRVVREVDARLALGPQADEVVALIERASRLTVDEAAALDAARVAARVAAWVAARDAAVVAARVTALDAAMDAAQVATWVAARGATWVATRDAAWVAALDAAWVATLDAAVALVMRDLQGQHGFTQDDYNVLSCPWRTVIGPIHPDDPDIKKES